MKKAITYRNNFTDFFRPLAIFNFLVAQWFFVRLARIGKYDENNPSIFIQTGWTLKLAIPLSGWWGNYAYLSKGRQK